MRGTNRGHPEFDMQCALFSWAALLVRVYPALRLLRGSMNGVHLSKAQAGKAKAAGVLKGEHDITLPVSRGGFVGLSVELKAGNNKPTKEQLDYGTMLEAEGWYVSYCWEWDKAALLIQDYLEGKITKS